jgi:hypothetical protein
MAKEDTTAEAVNDEVLSDDEALTAAEEEYFESGGTKGELAEQDDDESEQAEAKSEDKTEDARDEKSTDSEANDKTETKSEDADAEEDGKQKTVPHGALHAEREEHKQTKAALSQMQQNQAMLQGRLEQMAQLIQPQEQQTEDVNTPPDPNEDPLAAMNWIIQNQVEQQQLNQKAREQQAQQQQIADAQQNIRDNVMGKLSPAMESDPTLTDARDHVKASLITEAKMQGATDQQALGYVQHIEMQNMALIHRNNLDPAEYLKQFATNRGWTPKTNNDSGEDDGSKTAEQIAAQAKAADKHKSLSSAAGGSVASGEDIANMSDEEFSEWYEKQGDKGFQKATAA